MKIKLQNISCAIGRTNSIFSGNISSLLSCSIGRGQPGIMEMMLSGEEEGRGGNWKDQ